MGTAGASIRTAPLLWGLGCAIALAGSIYAAPLQAADTAESATAEVWSKAVTDSGSSETSATPAAVDSPAALPAPVAPLAIASASAAPSGAAAVASPAPSTTYALPMAITSPDSDALHVDPADLPPEPSNLTATLPDPGLLPPTTEEIPTLQAAHEAAAAAAQPPSPSTADAGVQAGSGSSSPTDVQDNPDVARYEREQMGYYAPPQFRDRQPFMYGAFTSPIGVRLEESSRRLSDGEEADGLLILDVAKGSPAANAGLKGYQHTAQSIATGLAIAAGLVFPPAIMAVPIIDFTQAGQSYDLIIGVDGTRVSNFLDFEDRTRDLRPGEILYLSVVHNGKRQQVRVFLPPGSTPTS